MALLLGTPASALDPTRSLEQLTHKAWTVEDGAPAAIHALAQSRDGYLWIGTARGLYRFDGVTFEHLPPFSGKLARSDAVTALLAASNGDVWLGHFWGGVSVYRDGRLQDANPAPPRGVVYQILQDSTGAIWVITDGCGALRCGASPAANGRFRPTIGGCPRTTCAGRSSRGTASSG